MYNSGGFDTRMSCILNYVRCKCMAEKYRLLNHRLLKHKRVVFVTTRYVVSGQMPRSTQTFSFLSLLQQPRGLRKIHNWDRRYVEGALSRSWSRRSDCEPARHRARGDCRGGSLSVCALDVGALTYSLISFVHFTARLIVAKLFAIICRLNSKLSIQARYRRAVLRNQAGRL